MSFFPSMFAASKDREYSRYLFQVNSLGETVIYRLDAEGKPTDFVCGDIAETVGYVLQRTHPALHLVDFRRQETSDPGFWFKKIRYGQRWRDVVTILNGKPSAAKRITEAEIDLYYQLKLPIDGWIKWAPWNGTDAELTVAAQMADAKADAEMASKE